MAPPTDLLRREAAPAIPVAAVESEDAYEDWRDARDAWGQRNAAIIDRACRWLTDAGVTLDCTTPE